MLQFLGECLEGVWGPFRLLKSHSFLIAFGSLGSLAVVLAFLPRLWRFLPLDRGKPLAADGGKQSAGKPTGAGLLFSLLSLPVAVLAMPMSVKDAGVLVCLFFVMLFGYLDDRSETPWGRTQKGLLDAAVSAAAAIFVYSSVATADGAEVWWPFFKETTAVPWWVYIPGATALLWISINATNCSDGVDGLAGSLVLISLIFLALFLYVVAGNAIVAKYLLVPASPVAPRWAILMMSIAGALGGYLWYNADPSRVLMGDAGSRFLGLAVGIGVLVAGNPFLLLVFAPVILMNGGGGLFKIMLLKFFRRLGMDVAPPGAAGANHGGRPLLPRLLHHYRFPLHDHCRHKLGWSKGQVLMRFMLLQAFLMPLIFVLFVKIR